MLEKQNDLLLTLMLTNNQTNCSNKKQETVQKIELKSIGNKISNNP